MKFTMSARSTTGAREIAAFLFVAACGIYLLSSPAFAWSIADEIRKGKEEAARVEEESEFVTDEALVKRVEEIGSAVARAALGVKVRVTYGTADEADFEYSFKVIDDGDVNAFALPGGYVYVNKGLLNFVQSDDELAAVIAHEVAHVAHHHAMHLLKSQQKTNAAVMAAVLAGAVAGIETSDLGNILAVADLVSLARLSGYGQKAEFDADRTAVAYLAATKYNPVGILTFMERLARDAGRKPEVHYGILAAHPPSYLRAREIVAELERMNIKINRRLVTSYLRVQVKPAEAGDVSAADVCIGDIRIIRMADSGGQKASTRAEAVAAKIETALLAGVRIHEIKIGGGGQYVTMRGRVVISPSAEDAVAAGKTIAEVTSDAKEALKKALWHELVEQAY